MSQHEHSAMDHGETPNKPAESEQAKPMDHGNMPGMEPSKSPESKEQPMQHDAAMSPPPPHRLKSSWKPAACNWKPAGSSSKRAANSWKPPMLPKAQSPSPSPPQTPSPHADDGHEHKHEPKP